MTHALVTGGARGIGAAIATGHVRAGGTVLVTDVDDEAGERLVASLGDAARYCRADVTSESDVQRAFEVARSRGPLDAVYANAGAVGVTGGIESTSLEAWRGTVDLLLTSVFLTVREAVAAMRPRGEGSIVCTASVASLRGGLGPHVYTAAKHGVVGLVESVAVEVARYGLRINAVAPGGAVSALSARLIGGDLDALDEAERRLAEGSLSGRATTAQHVADAALFLAGAGAARVNGTTLAVDGADFLPSHRGLSYYA